MATTSVQLTQPKGKAEARTESRTASKTAKTELATFAAGCFWGVEEIYRTLPGVLKTRVGYTGGHMKNPTYWDVAGQQTGHAEAVEITYDPKIVSYEQLLQLFWENHDPTTLNRDGPNIGPEYRSAIFYHSENQRKAAENSKKTIQAMLDQQNKNANAVIKAFGGGPRTVVTQIVPAQTFYPAEEHHQQYLAKRGAKVCH